jgi:hypothetical protein
VPSGEGIFGLPSPKRRDTGASLAPMTTTPWIENASTAKAMVTVPLRMAAPWPEIGLLFEQHYALHEVQ